MRKFTYVNVEHSLVSRYKTSRALRDTDGNVALENPPRVIYSKDQYIFHVVQLGEQGRLDRIAAKYYGEGKYWWIIAYANNFIDPFIVQEGDLLRIPPMDSIFRVKGLREA